MNPKVDFFFNKANRWNEEFRKLRMIALDTGLKEELKWGVPCYTYTNNNIVLIHGFKEYCALLFHKGALLSDADNILVQQTENVQSARQIRFTNLSEILEMETIIKSYIHEAKEVEKSGLKVEFKQTKEYDIPEELQLKLDEDPTFKSAFNALTPGRQRGYILHFSQPKQSTTRTSRIKRCTEKILQGIGLNDR